MCRLKPPCISHITYSSLQNLIRTKPKPNLFEGWVFYINSLRLRCSCASSSLLSVLHFLTLNLLSSWVWFSWSEFSWLVEVKGSLITRGFNLNVSGFLEFPSVCFRIKWGVSITATDSLWWSHPLKLRWFYPPTICSGFRQGPGLTSRDVFYHIIFSTPQGWTSTLCKSIDCQLYDSFTLSGVGNFWFWTIYNRTKCLGFLPQTYFHTIYIGEVVKTTYFKNEFSGTNLNVGGRCQKCSGESTIRITIWPNATV